VLTRLKEAQAAERAYEKFVGPGTWGELTTFHAVGPIAIIGGPQTTNPTVLSKLEELSKSYDKLTNVADKYAQIINNDPSREFNFPMRGYLDQMKAAIELANQLSAKLTDYDHPALSNLSTDFDEFNESVRAAQANSANANKLASNWSGIFDPKYRPKIQISDDNSKSSEPKSTVGSWNDLTYSTGSGGRTRQTITATGDVFTFRTENTASKYLPAFTDVVTFPDITRLNLSPILKVEEGTWDLTIQGDFNEQYDGGHVTRRNAEYRHLTFGSQEQAVQAYNVLKAAISNHRTVY
jgi:hypothetical protein